MHQYIANRNVMGTADHTGGGVQHSLQCEGRRFWHTCQDSVAVVNAWRNKRMYDSVSSECRDCWWWRHHSLNLTTAALLPAVDMHYSVSSRTLNPTMPYLFQALDVAHNHPVWKLLAVFDTMHCSDASQQRWWLIALRAKDCLIHLMNVELLALFCPGIKTTREVVEEYCMLYVFLWKCCFLNCASNLFSVFNVQCCVFLLIVPTKLLRSYERFSATMLVPLLSERAFWTWLLCPRPVGKEAIFFFSYACHLP